MSPTSPRSADQTWMLSHSSVCIGCPQTHPCGDSSSMSESRWISQLAHASCQKPSPGLSHSHGVATGVNGTFQGPRDDGDTELISTGPTLGTGHGAAPKRWHSPASPRQWPRMLPCIPMRSQTALPFLIQQIKPKLADYGGNLPLGTRQWWQDQADQAPH